MSWAGVLWLSWMSWQLFSAPAANLSSRLHVRFTARAAALLQVVNPKTWMMALAVVSLFAPASDHAFRDIALMALWFLAISVVCLLCWAWLGKAVNRISAPPWRWCDFSARWRCVCLFPPGRECWLRSEHHPYDTARTAKYLPPDGAPYPHPPGYGSPTCGSGNLPAPAPSASRPLPDHPLQVWSAARV